MRDRQLSCIDKKQLGRQIPENAPTFGDTVMMRNLTEGKVKSFHPKGKEAVFLSWDMTVTNGAVVTTYTPSGALTIHYVSGPAPWPQKSQIRSWRIVTNPFNEREKARW